MDSLSLGRLLPKRVTDYYRYSGSLTTPACDEVVEWFVIDSPVLSISDDQLLSFQSVEDNRGYPMLTNARPIQEINFRTVRRSFGPDIEPPKSKNLVSASGFNFGHNLKPWNVVIFMGMFIFFLF